MAQPISRGAVRATWRRHRRRQGERSARQRPPPGRLPRPGRRPHTGDPYQTGEPPARAASRQLGGQRRSARVRSDGHADPSRWTAGIPDLGARLQWGRQSGSTAQLVAPDPATSPIWGAVPVRPTLAAEAEQVTDPGALSRRPGAEPARTNVPGGVRRPACASGSVSVCPGPAAVGRPRGEPRLTVSSGAGPAASRRRRRRAAEMLLVVRRAERDGELLDGKRTLGSRP